MALLAPLLLVAALALGGPACRISEFPCRNLRCVRLDRYCDGVDDCGDKSDEPRYCTVCNRTYYGDVAKTYELELHKPKEERLPYLCHLTFTANGRGHGELVQLIFDAFHVGRYEPSALDGCPDGYMQLSELGRPFTGGSWCGFSSGYAVYYSETTTVTVSVKLFPSPHHTDTPFEFRLRYKFVGRDEAVVRFGSASAPLERGEVVPGTYCSRNFYECYRKRCRLQSPNYPGMYPRNVTCYLTLRQKTVPNCKHAMISVRQDSAHKVQIKRAVPAVASFNKTTRALRAWNDCTGERDHLIFYDGASTDDPVLVKFCGGDWLPRVVSRGPEMLVAFHSSPFSIPLHADNAPSPLRGFELDVDVLFSDSDSFDFSRDSRRCEFWVNASSPDSEDVWARSRGRAGHVLSPRHTLAPNSTCTYRFRGHPRDRIWIYFVAYSHQSLLLPPASTAEAAAAAAAASAAAAAAAAAGGADNATLAAAAAAAAAELAAGSLRPGPGPGGGDPGAGAAVPLCATRLRIWDGGGGETDVLLADHCDADPPRLCDHTSLGNATRMTRPCSPTESYVSTGSTLTLAHSTFEGTALHPAAFRLRYEFVDTRLGGEPWPGRRGEEPPPPQPCSRVFRRVRSGEFWSPRNVFLYGRGGAHNLSCVFRLEAAAGEKVRLTLHNASFGENPACSTEPDPHTGRPRCARGPDAAGADGRVAELRLFEVPWRDVRVPRVCLCDNSTLSSTGARHLVFKSTSRVLELHFTVSKLNITEDFTDLYFFASFEMVRSSECPRKQRLRGSGGEVQFVNPAHSRADASCEGLPWLVEAHENRSLFLLTWGTFLPVQPSADEPARCHTRNRVLIYSGKPARLLRVVCPASPNARQYAVHVFSEEWFGSGGAAAVITGSQADAAAGPAGAAGTSGPGAGPGSGGGGGGAGDGGPAPGGGAGTGAGAGAGAGPGPGPGGGGGGVVLLQPPRPPSFLVEWVGREAGVASFNWLEISRSRSSLLQQLQMDVVEAGGNASGGAGLPADWECPHRCPELNACISASLWCDGRNNCPSGFDEDESHCGAGRRLLTFVPGGLYTLLGGAAALAAACCLLACVSLGQLVRRRGRRGGLSKKGGGVGGGRGEPRRVPTEEMLLDPSGSTTSS